MDWFYCCPCHDEMFTVANSHYHIHFARSNGCLCWNPRVWIARYCVEDCPDTVEEKEGYLWCYHANILAPSRLGATDHKRFNFWWRRGEKVERFSKGKAKIPGPPGYILDHPCNSSYCWLVYKLPCCSNDFLPHPVSGYKSLETPRSASWNHWLARNRTL